MFAVGVAVGIATGFFRSWWLSPAAGWAAACLLYVVWVWVRVGLLDAKHTHEHATREDPGSALSELLILVASVASLGAVVVLLIRSNGDSNVDQGVTAGLALISVALSWALIHTLYMLRYARVYYTEPVGGINFNSPDEPPRYMDFAYVSFNLGMTFQMSDTTLQTSQLRSIVFKHALLSYLFGSVVLATLISLVAGLGS